jgi:hypothetical protein
MQTPMQALAAVRKMGIQPPRLPLGHTLASWEITEDSVKLVIFTARCTPLRQGVKVTHRGVAGYLFRRISDGSWVTIPPVMIEEALAEPELIGVGGRTADAVLESDQWARLCYRPGTTLTPMDGPSGSSPSVR